MPGEPAWKARQRAEEEDVLGGGAGDEAARAGVGLLAGHDAEQPGAVPRGAGEQRHEVLVVAGEPQDKARAPKPRRRSPARGHPQQPRRGLRRAGGRRGQEEPVGAGLGDQRAALRRGAHQDRNHAAQPGARARRAGREGDEQGALGEEPRHPGSPLRRRPRGHGPDARLPGRRLRHAGAARVRSLQRGPRPPHPPGRPRPQRPGLRPDDAEGGDRGACPRQAGESRGAAAPGQHEDEGGLGPGCEAPDHDEVRAHGAHLARGRLRGYRRLGGQHARAHAGPGAPQQPQRPAAAPEVRGEPPRRASAPEASCRRASG
mmetsp:Transcript_73209/g.214595  ORF Transcript_73209/g.214595 Transcript_73209/m.214595 type:complete len:317 (-) Transcript_73209:147-1097(-)